MNSFINVNKYSNSILDERNLSKIYLNLTEAIKKILKSYFKTKNMYFTIQIRAKVIDYIWLLSIVLFLSVNCYECDKKG